MRICSLALAVTGMVAFAGVAMADVNIPVVLTLPEFHHGGPPGPAGDPTSRPQRYLARLQTLHARLLKLKAADGGELTAAHEASLRRELDKLNRIYGAG